MLKGGAVVARWGDTQAVDMTFSVAKSYLALLAGVAVLDGLLPNLDARVRDSVDDGGFDSPQNAPITWRMLLTNTSEWEGELFGKPDSIDRGRDLSAEGQGAKGVRALQPAGTHWEYNDVRVNRLSLALLRLFGRPLPAVFAERIMRPLGASSRWQWHGYATSWVELGGRPVQSVSGGGHWGGGVFIHAEDQALLGQLVLADGVWRGQRLLPAGWVRQCTTPCGLNPVYGFLCWLNTGGEKFPSAPAESYGFSGAGGNITWVLPAQQMVVVTRWLAPAAQDGLLALALA